MTPNVHIVSPGTTVVEIADIFESRHIKRVPVLDGEKLVGIVGRANLVQALVTQAHVPTRSYAASDGEIRDLLYDEVAKIGRASQPIDVTVGGGIVHLWGFVRGEAERKAVLIAARGIPGRGHGSSSRRSYPVVYMTQPGNVAQSRDGRLPYFVSRAGAHCPA